MFFPRRAALWLAAGLFVLSLAGCKAQPAAPPTAAASQPPGTPAPTLTLTPFQPSPIPPPAAALVNGEIIPLAAYQAELARYQAALGVELATSDRERVLNELIDQALLAQGAYAAGFAITPAQIQGRIAALEASLGGAQTLTGWMAANGFTMESFASQLEHAAAAAWMRDQVAAAVPASAEQVHTRQILHYNAEEAAAALARLNAGEDFAALAGEFDPVTGGEVGWSPRNILFDPALEEAAFALQPGEYSAVVQTSAGYHIIQVIERQADRPLAPQALLAWQQRALADWLTAQRAASDIQLLAP